MLSQKIGLYAERLLRTKESGQQSTYQGPLIESIDLFEKSHNQIYNGDWVEGKKDSISLRSKTYYSEVLNPLVVDYIKESRKIASLERSVIDFDKLEQLLLKLDQAVDIFEEESSLRISLLRTLELTFFLITLFVLALEVFFIFRPLEKILNRTIDRLQKEKKEAEDAKKLKSTFISNVTHEIRTPLNGIIGSLDLIDRDGLDSENRSYFEVIDSCANSSLRLINDILDFEKLSAGQFKIRPEWVELDSLIKKVEAMFDPIALAKNLDFKVHSSIESLEVYADLFRVEQCLANVLSNAFKFTQIGGVTLNVFRQDEKFIFEVIDSGVGISEEGKKLIYKEFGQVYEQNLKPTSGTGLGLSITKNLINLMNGDIILTSEYDKGSIFRLVFSFDSRAVIRPISHTSQEKNIYVKAGNVLLIEDNEINQKIFKGFLDKLGLDYKIADNGKLGLQALENETFDYIFCDIQMPIMNGLEFMEALKKKYPHFPTAIYAVTANGNKEDIDLYKKKGFEAVLTKPLRFSELKNFLDQAS